jgi:hypothetical protein
VAVVFADVVTCRSVQMKGFDAEVVGLAEGDAARIRAYRDEFFRAVESVDTPPEVARGMWSEDHVALVFTPVELYDQTPGPGAGERVAGR